MSEAKNETTTALSTDIGAILAANRSNMPAKSDILAISKSGDYRERLQLCGSNSKLVKKKKITCGNWAMVRSQDDFDDLGVSVDVFPIAYRALALDMSGETPISVFDQNSAAFADIAARSNESDSGCVYGPEILVWVPSVRSFAGLHFNGKSSRKEAPKIVALLENSQNATLTNQLIETKKYTWESPVINQCTTPIVMPTAEQLQKELNKWNAEATAAAPEKVETSTSNRAR